MKEKTVERIGGSAPSISLSSPFRKLNLAVMTAAFLVFAMSAASLKAQSSQTVPKPGVNMGIPIPNPANVNVVNTPTVNVGNAVTLSGTPTVNVGSLPAVTATITGTPSVSVTNSKASPVPTQDVDHPGRHPYTAICSTTSGGASVSTLSCNPLPSPPSGAQVVIQDVNLASGSNVSPNTFFPTFNYTAGGNPIPIFLPGSMPDTADVVVNQLVALYPDVKSSFTCASNVTSATVLSITCSISGYTITP